MHPHTLHAAQVLACAEAKKHVFCEKPLALTRADAERVVAACKAAGVVLGIGHERRYEPAIVEVRRLLREGALGTVMHVEANFSHDKLANVPAGDWRTSPKDAPAAGMTAMGIHLDRPVRGAVRARAARCSPPPPRAWPIPTTATWFRRCMRFESGATGYFNAILVTPHYLCLTVFGSKAWVEVRNETHPDTPGPSMLTLQHADGRTRRADTSGWTRCAPTSRPSRRPPRAARPIPSPTRRRSATSPCWRRSAARSPATRWCGSRHVVLEG